MRKQLIVSVLHLKTPLQSEPPGFGLSGVFLYNPSI